MAPGLPKLNISQQSYKSAFSNAMARATRSTVASSGMYSRANTSIFPTGSMGGGRSFGIMAQRSATGSGTIYNAKAYYGQSLTQQGIELNRQSTHVFNNIGNFSNMAPQVRQDNTMNKFAMALMATKVLTGLIGEIISLTKSEGAGGAKTETNTNDAAGINNTNGNTNGVMSQKLASAKSFKDINSVEADANKKLDNFQQDYTKNISDSLKGIDDLLKGDKMAEGLKLAGVNIDTSKLSGSNLQIDTDDLASLDTAADTIDKDIKTANDFISTDIENGVNSLVKKSGELSQTIGKLTSDFNRTKAAEDEASKNGTAMPSPSSAEIQKQIDEAKANKAKIDEAKVQLNGTVKNSIKDMINSLTSKKSELADIKNVKTKLADTKYDLAKSQDEEISSNKKQMDKLDGEIEKYKSQMSDPKKKDKAEAKLKAAIQQFNSMTKVMSALSQSLTDAGATEFTNGKGQKYTITNKSVDAKYTTPKQEYPDNSSQKLGDNPPLQPKDDNMQLFYSWGGAASRQYC